MFRATAQSTDKRIAADWCYARLPGVVHGSYCWNPGHWASIKTSPCLGMHVRRVACTPAVPVFRVRSVDLAMRRRRWETYHMQCKDQDLCRQIGKIPFKPASLGNVSIHLGKQSIKSESWTWQWLRSDEDQFRGPPAGQCVVGLPTTTCCHSHRCIYEVDELAGQAMS